MMPSLLYYFEPLLANSRSLYVLGNERVSPLLNQCSQLNPNAVTWLLNPLFILQSVNFSSRNKRLTEARVLALGFVLSIKSHIPWKYCGLGACVPYSGQGKYPRILLQVIIWWVYISRKEIVRTDEMKSVWNSNHPPPFLHGIIPAHCCGKQTMETYGPGSAGLLTFPATKMIRNNYQEMNFCSFLVAVCKVTTNIFLIFKIMGGIDRAYARSPLPRVG